MLPNEQFSGKGRARHICKTCKRLPVEERDAIEQMDELYGYLAQSHISKKNVKRLQLLSESQNPKIATHASIVLDVARVKPYKKHRLKYLAKNHPEILRNLNDTGLRMAHGY
ncbi:MAG: hypothetical protein DRJ65_01165 [Acidobacteria bacterium]|nr:MAG: hypothetical protein DRJ65_01165 [Acidobacteriota bacterium]